MGNGKKGRLLKRNLIDAIKTYISPKRSRVADLRGITRFQGNFKNWELLPRIFTNDPMQFFSTNKRLIEPKVISELRGLDSIKLQTALKIKFAKERPDQEDVITGVFTFNCKNTPVLNKRGRRKR